MKIIVLSLYVLITIIYLSPIGDTSRLWKGIDLINHISCLGYLCYLMESHKRNSKAERLFFMYLKFLSIGNAIYIVWCLLRGSYWSIYHTDIFAYILGIGFIAFMFHLPIRLRKKS
jgi:hypothetical protein